jgi:ureidoglycolate dehydrogenase (NAD+)
MEEGAHPGEAGHFVAAIRVSAFEEVDVFKGRVDKAIQQIHNSRKAPNVDRLYAPGEPEAIRRENYRREGIPLNDITLGDIKKTADARGVATNGYAWL